MNMCLPKDPQFVGQQARFSEQLHTQLNLLKSHGLEDLHNAKLMNRVDSKFLIPLSLLPDILKAVMPYYSVLAIKGKRISTYHNKYFDTSAFAFYQDHHNGKLNRFKVRERCYVDTDTRFLEVKFKNNKKRTIKSRVKLDQLAQQPGAAINQAHNQQLKAQLLEQQLGKSMQELHCVQQGGYQRIALANEQQGERLTLDFALWFATPNNRQLHALPGFFIAELKQQKKNKHSPFFQLMSREHIYPMSFSKYCVGCAVLFGDKLKANRFKQTLSQVARFKTQQSGAIEHPVSTHLQVSTHH